MLQRNIENHVDAINDLLKDIKIDSVILRYKLKNFWLEMTNWMYLIDRKFFLSSAFAKKKMMQRNY